MSRAMAGEWQPATIGDIASKARNALVGGPFDSNLVSADYVDHGVPVIRGQNMGERWVAGNFAYVSPTKAESLEANLARPGDIVFTQRGTLGQVCLVPQEPYDRYLVSQSQMKLTVDRDRTDPLFIFYVFRSPGQRHYIRQHAIQTGVPHTNLGILRGTPMTIPPLEEQRAIAHILGTLDDKLELNRRMSATLEATARTIFRSWFADFDPVRAKAEGRDPGLLKEIADLFPDRFEDSELGEIPAGWSVRPVGDLASIVGGSTPSTVRAEFWLEGQHRWATPKDLAALHTPVLLDTERRVTDAGLAQISSGLLPRGTVLLSSRAPIGYLAVAEEPVAINQGFIAMQPKGPVSNLYLLFWARLAHDDILSRANGSTFLEISKSNFRPIPVVRPPDRVFATFDALVRPSYASLVASERESRSLAALRDSLLPKLVSGELRVRDAERFLSQAGA